MYVHMPAYESILLYILLCLLTFNFRKSTRKAAKSSEQQYGVRRYSDPLTGKGRDANVWHWAVK